MSGTKRTIRIKPLRAAMRCVSHPLTIGLAGLLLSHGTVCADQLTWDCRMGPDGRSWQCYKDGQAVQDPAEPEPEAEQSTLVSPPQPPTATQAVEPGRPAPQAPDTAPAAEPAAEPDSAAPVSPKPASGGAAVPRPAVPDPASPKPAAEAVTAPLASPAAAAAEVATMPQQATGAPDAPHPPAAATRPDPAAAAQAFDDSAMPDLLAPVETTPEVRPETEPDATTAAAVDIASMSPGPAPIAGGLDDGIDWGSCGAITGKPDISLEGPPAGTAIPIDISADAAVARLDPQQAIFSGNVQLVQGSLEMNADELILNRDSGDVDAKGRFLLRHPDIRIAGSAASYQLDTGRAQIEQASYRVPAMRARGDADHADLLGDGQSQYRNITYTTCRPGNADWLLTAEALELDQTEGKGSASHAKLRFLGVPVLYAPTFTFPIDNRRRSGLLVPSIGYGDSTGFDLSVPYYLNLAENYDLTLTPRLMAKRGLMLGGEFRFLTETTEGTLAAEYLPDDSEYNGKNSDRGSASLRSFTQLNPRTDARLRLNYVSDSDYLSDLGSSLAATSETHLERAGELRYHADTWDLLGRVQYYQTIDDAILSEDRPYSRLPQLLVNLENPDGISGTTYHLAAEYVNFHRTDSMHGHRVALAPAISLPIRNNWSFVEPKIGARYVTYQLTDEEPGIGSSPSLFAGVFSLDSGLYFDRNTSYFGNSVSQTLEPRLYYLYVPEENQDDQPIFDTGAFDFNFDNLFRENRFNGPDRIGDANQVTLALTSRMISDQSGTELLRASIGQTFYFEDREVVLPGEPVDDNNSSALAAELAAQLGGGWYTRAGLQWDPHDGSNGTIDQALAQIGYRDNEKRVFNAAYRLRDGVTEQTDFAAFWPINDQISLVARHNYSLRDSRLLEALAGVEYGRCCWRVRALARKYTDSTGDDHNLAFLIQLELNGLGRFGDDIDQVLERGIYGYETD